MYSPLQVARLRTVMTVQLVVAEMVNMVVEQRSGRILGDLLVLRHFRLTLLRLAETFNNILY